MGLITTKTMLEMLRQQDEQHAKALAYYHELVTKLQAAVFEMKREGFQQPPAYHTEDVPALPPNVRQAIDQRAVPDSEQGLVEWAWEELEKGADPDEVAEEILRGAEIEGI